MRNHRNRSSMGLFLFAREGGLQVWASRTTLGSVRTVRTGARLHAVATPITRGRQMQVWQAQLIDDDEDRLVATRRVRLLCITEDQQLAGDQVKGALSDPSRS